MSALRLFEISHPDKDAEVRYKDPSGEEVLEDA